MDTLPKVIVGIGVAIVIAFLTLSIASVAVSVTGDSGTVQTAALLDGTDWTRLDDTVGTNQDVYDSRGYAVQLAGTNDSYIDAPQPVDVTNTTWTASVWASRDVDSDMAALSLDGRLIISYNATQSEWRAWYYDEGSTNSYRTSVPATSGQGQLENVVVVRDGDTLSLYANATNSNSTSITGESSVPAPTDSGGWDGRLEEIRLSHDGWNSTIRQAHYDSPIDPLPTDHAGRTMLDEPYRDSQRFFYASGDVQTQNVQFVNGLPGQELDGSSVLAAQSDYEWRQEGPQIRAIDGGELDGAPVAYVDYDSKGLVGTFVEDVNQTYSLLGLAFLAMLLATVVGYLQIGTRR